MSYITHTLKNVSFLIGGNMGHNSTSSKRRRTLQACKSTTISTVFNAVLALDNLSFFRSKLGKSKTTPLKSEQALRAPGD